MMISSVLGWVTIKSSADHVHCNRLIQMYKMGTLIEQYCSIHMEDIVQLLSNVGYLDRSGCVYITFVISFSFPFFQSHKAYVEAYQRYKSNANGRDAQQYMAEYHNAHNEFVLQIRASNRQHEEYHTAALPYVLEVHSLIGKNIKNQIHILGSKY